MVDFSEIFGGLKDQAAKAFDDAKATGVPALEASLEKWGADSLQGMANQSQATVDTNVKEILNRPPATGLGAYLSNTFKSPLVQQYGGTTIVAMVAVGVLALLIFKKG